MIPIGGGSGCDIMMRWWYVRRVVSGFAATSETPWNFRYNIFSTMFQKECIGGYLVDGSRYVGLKIHLLRPYTFRDTACTR
jgi:hypothetical protein